MSASKKQLPLATFRISTDKAELWESFKAKTEVNKTTGAALFWQFVQNYVDGIDTSIDSSIDSNIDERVDKRIDDAVSSAIAPLLVKIDKLESDYQYAIIDAKHELRGFVIQGLTGAIDKPYFGIEETSDTSLEKVIQTTAPKKAKPLASIAA